MDDVKTCVREQIIQHFACSIPLRVEALRLLRETGSFLCQRYSDPNQNDDEGEQKITGDMASASGDSAKTDCSSGDEARDDELDDSATSQRAPSETSPSETSPSETSPSETSPSETSSSDASAIATDASDAAVSTEESGAPNVLSTKPLSVKKRALSVADDRRQRRKQARMRRRAHLEATLKDYFDRSIPLSRLTIHQFADIDYGERVRVLSIRLTYDQQRLDDEVAAMVVPENSHHGLLLHSAWAEAQSRHILGDCERIIRREFSEQMESHVIQAVKRHVRTMCMQRPLTETVLAISAHRDGFSMAVVNGAGQVLTARDLSRNEYGPDKIQQAIKEVVAELHPAHVAVGASERTRLIQQMLAGSLGNELKESQVGWLTVPEEGVANYCRSAKGCEEIPGVSPEHRITIALARRVQEPLLQFVKVEPRDWLSEQQQTTVNVQRLRTEIQSVYQTCLARIGVDVNTAPPLVLEQLPGLNESVARKIEAHRIANDRFTTIAQLCQAIDLGPTVTELIGFLRIKNGDEPLDAIGIHPEHYSVAEQLLGHCEVSKTQLAAEVTAGVPQHSVTPTTDATATTDSPAGDRLADPTHSPKTTELDSTSSSTTPPPGTNNNLASRADWDQRFRSLDLQRLSESFSITREQARRLVNELRFAGRDVRENSRQPVIRMGSLRSEDLEPGELLAGQVINTAPFGAFVEIAPGTVGLIHVSRLGDGYVRDPREILMEGERIPVWVLSVDRERKRIALSLSPPGAARSERRGRPTENKRVENVATRESTRRSGQARITRPRKQSNYTPKPSRPKRVVPITEGMKTGNEPMRTFGDLKQFFDISKTPKSKPPKTDVPKKGKSDPSGDPAES